MAHVTHPLAPSPEEQTELEQKTADAKRSAAVSAVPSVVVDRFACLRDKLNAANVAISHELDDELADELERPLDEADEDLRLGRHVPRDAVFPRHHPAG